jgi:hypothetical protein
VLKVLVLVVLLGLAIYLVVRSVQGRGGTPPPKRAPRRPPPRPVAPDDDPDFLRGIRFKKPNDKPDE